MLPAIRRPARSAERTLDRGHGPEGDARSRAVRRRGAEDGSSETDAVGGAPLERCRALGVDADHGQVAVAVDRLDRADLAAPVGEGHGDLAAAQVVGIGEDAAVADDDAGSALVATDRDDRRAGALGKGCDGGLELVEQGHGGACLPGWRRDWAAASRRSPRGNL
jgi:hypothetical protein